MKSSELVREWTRSAMRERPSVRSGNERREVRMRWQVLEKAMAEEIEGEREW
jgi:hypothetical protein